MVMKIVLHIGKNPSKLRCRRVRFVIPDTLVWSRGCSPRKVDAIFGYINMNISNS